MKSADLILKRNADVEAMAAILDIGAARVAGKGRPARAECRDYTMNRMCSLSPATRAFLVRLEANTTAEQLVAPIEYAGEYVERITVGLLRRTAA